jgi:soluble P-type ATPase
VSGGFYVLELTVPGRLPLTLSHLVLDYNGTLATDGRLHLGVAERLVALSGRIDLHVITADTFGLAAVELGSLPVTLQVIGAGNQANDKLALVTSLGAGGVMAVGNGANDEHMLKAAALGICVLGAEGAATPTLLASDIVVRSAVDALDLLLHPGRLAATLRV